MYSMAYFLFVDDSYRLKSISDQKKSLRIQCLTLTTSFFFFDNAGKCSNL